MGDNKKKSSKIRQISTNAPPQIANFFSKPRSPNNELSPSSTTTTPPSPNDRKRKLSEQEASSQNENRNTYAETLQKDAAKISKIQKTKKVGTLVSTFFQQGSSDDLSEIFESPHKRMQLKPPPAIPKKKVTRKRKLPTKSNTKKNALETELFEKVLLHHSSADGLNSDDLQMALALSRSLTDTHSSNGESSSVSSIIQNAEPSDKEDMIRRTFQKFGFKKSDSNNYDCRDIFVNFGSKKKWSSKFTPLTRRSEYMQKQKFKMKVKNILKISYEIANCEVVQEYSITSSYLQQFFIPKCPSYVISLADTDTVVEDYYVNDLVPISTLRCLLKSWDAIPGRDISPQRSITESCNVNNTTVSSEEHSESTSVNVEQEKGEFNDPTTNLELSDDTKYVAQHDICNSPHNVQQSAALTDSSLNTSINLTSERQLLSPDMFADYESSADNSFNDDHTNNCNVDARSNTPPCSSNVATVKDSIVLSSEDSNEGCTKTISEPTSVTNQQKSIDFPSIVTISKHLSFTDRLQMYNSDPALGIADDDPMCRFSQDSIVISDDEINYSLYHGAGDEEHSTVLSVTKHHDHTINMPTQESIVLSDSDDQMPSQLSDEAEERQSFASIEMSSENDVGNESLDDLDPINHSVRELCEKDFVSSSVHSSIKCPTIINEHSQESILLSDSNNPMASQLSDEDEAEERQSFLSIDISTENDTPSKTGLDINIDDDIFNSKHSLNDEDLVNLSVREMCQKEFVSSSAKASTSKSFSRATSDMTFERKLWTPSRTASRTTNKFNTSAMMNFSDDEFDEFDRLVRGDRCPSVIPKENSIEISDDDEFHKSFKSQPINVPGDEFSVLHSPTPTECNEFIVQSMDQMYQVRTGRLVSPKQDYEKMDSPTRLVHLKKYGLKALSKRKAVICLEHIYNRLHPFIELNERDDLDNILSQKDTHAIGSSQNGIDDMNINHGTSEPLVESNFDALQENEDVFFLPSAPRAKKPWCLQPLHIAWHNLVNSNQTLCDDILQYKPVDLMSIRSLLKSIDLRYETNGLIAFLDRKCITFKTDNKRNQALKKN